MTSEEWLQKAQELVDNNTCWESVEDELLKLYCLFSRCSCIQTSQGVDILTREYVVGKLVRVLSKVPIILDGDTKRLYATLKMESIKPKVSGDDEKQN